jgi:hypothetical protein
MEQRTIDDGELRQWIDEWGEESHDDILPSDDEADIANRILEHHTRGEYPDDVDWNDAWESLRSIIEPALEHVHGFFPDGAETLARYVREIDMGIDPDTGEDLERAAIEEPAFRTSFRIRAMTDADPEDEPALDKVIQAADADYRHDVISGGVPLNWIRGRLDEWIRTAPIDADARYTWTAGLADQSERDVMRVWAEDELAQVVEDHYWNFPGGRNSCMEFYSRPDFISESYVEWKAGLLSEGDLERTDRADTDPLGDPRAFGATTPTR